MHQLGLLALVAACGYQDPVAEQPDAPEAPVDAPDVMLGRFDAPARGRADERAAPPRREQANVSALSPTRNLATRRRVTAKSVCSA